MSQLALTSPPDPRAVHRAIRLPLALIGALLAHPVLLQVSDAVREADRVRGDLGWAAVALCTALVSVVHLRLAAPGKSPGVVLPGRTAGAVFTRAVVFGMLLGPINSGISLAAVVALRYGAEPGVLGALVMGTLFGSVAGGCIGLFFGIGYAPLAILAARHRDRPTYAGPDKARALVGAMVLAAAFVHHVCLPDGAAFQALGALVGVGLLAVAGYRWRGLQRFLRDVRAGKEPRWSLAAPRDPSDVAGLLPIHAGSAPAEVLYRAANDELLVSPYRSQSQWIPVARIAA